MSTLIIGVGSSLRSDDGVGVVVAEALQRHTDDTALKIMTCHQLLPELVDDIRQVSRVIFIDASVMVPAGEIHTEPVMPLAPSQVMLHHMSPPQLLTLTKQLYNTCPDAYLISIGVASLEVGVQLSPLLQRKIPDYIAHMKTILSMIN